VSVTSADLECNTTDHHGRERGLDDLTCSIATRSHPHTASADTRHTGLTHLGETGASLPMLMAKSRHKKPENLRRYFHPSAEAIAEVTSLLAPWNISINYEYKNAMLQA
jgi:integrase/recombinase XerC